MDQDSLRTDSLASRPLPKWLTDQRDGLNAYQPVKVVMKEDHSLQVSFAITGIFIVLLVGFLTFFVLRKYRNNK